MTAQPTDRVKAMVRLAKFTGALKPEQFNQHLIEQHGWGDDELATLVGSVIRVVDEKFSHLSHDERHEIVNREVHHFLMGYLMGKEDAA